MRANNPALYSNELGAKMERVALEFDDKIFACRRSLEGNEVYGFFNFSDEPRVIALGNVLPIKSPKLVITLNDTIDSTLDRMKIQAWSCVIYCY
jgi:hypothetical protein